MKPYRNNKKKVHVIGGGGNVGKALNGCNNQFISFRYWYKTEEEVLFYSKFFKEDCGNINFMNRCIEPDDFILDLRNFPFSQRCDIEEYLIMCRSLVNAFPRNLIIFCSSIASSGLIGSDTRRPCTLYGYAKLALEKEFENHERVKIIRLGNVFSPISPYVSIISNLNDVGRIETKLTNSKQIVTTPNMIVEFVKTNDVGVHDCFNELDFTDLCSDYGIELNATPSEDQLYDNCSFEFLEIEKIYHKFGVWGVLYLFVFFSLTGQRYINKKFYLMIFSSNFLLGKIIEFLRIYKKVFYSTDLKSGYGDKISNFNFLFSGIRK